MMFTLVAMLTLAVSANAMSYEQARNEALFLTDKMAYELNLTDEQYEAAYEINLDYLMGVTGRADVFGTYWERRNLDLSYILYDWQWNAYIAASYCYRPLYWEAGYWHFGIYRRYPHRDYFYFGRPHFYATYRGGHAWHLHGNHGYYYGHRDVFRAPRQNHFGMHDRWDRGDFRNHRNSSTRVTGGHNDRRIDNNNRRPGFDGARGNRSFGNGSAPSRSNEQMNRTMPSRSGSGNFSGSRGSSAPSRSFGNSSMPSRSSATPSRSISAPSRSISAPSRSSSAPSRSVSAPTRSSGSSSHSGGSHSSGGHFGGHR